MSPTPTTLTSETRAIVVVPTLSAAALAGTTVTATVQPSLAPPRRVRLLMDPTGGGASVAVPAAALPGGGTTNPTLDVTDVDPGTYRLTLEVDGIRSIPTLDGSGHYVNLEVTV